LLREPLSGADGDVKRLSIGAIRLPNGHPREEYELSRVAGERGGTGFEVKTLQVGSHSAHAAAPLERPLMPAGSVRHRVTAHAAIGSCKERGPGMIALKQSWREPIVVEHLLSV
jgi:hypothetical protein